MSDNECMREGAKAGEVFTIRGATYPRLANEPMEFTYQTGMPDVREVCRRNADGTFTWREEPTRKTVENLLDGWARSMAAEARREEREHMTPHEIVALEACCTVFLYAPGNEAPPDVAQHIERILAKLRRMREGAK